MSLQPLCDLLRVPESALASLPPSLIERAITSLDLPLHDQAAIALLLQQNTTDASSTLSGYFARQEQRSREPWRVMLDRALDVASRASTRSDDEITLAFTDAAKSALLTPDLAIAACYSVCGNTASQKFFAAIMCLPAKQRVQLHNFYVAHATGPDFVDAVGAQLMDLEVPLFPPLPALRSLNLRLIAEASTPPSGGAPSERRARQQPSVFLPTDPAGGGYLTVQTTDDGRQLVDTSEVEAAFSVVFQRLQELEKLLPPAVDRSLVPALRGSVSHARNLALPARRARVQQRFGRRTHHRAPQGGNNNTENE